MSRFWFIPRFNRFDAFVIFPIVNALIFNDRWVWGIPVVLVGSVISQLLEDRENGAVQAAKPTQPQSRS